eukprot:CAMPEP_0175912236 /NCGR_PEP_ID=MMETSP0108-20121206/8616_1 /TAXON_ID=195067 ORGANISM="Goniomonas pacifica, Strain CCMP1869" /NCGR_SAMPLE_ID=MMETSP0108 /ASSEMBLY_ACC=CAM_ASM_000204 /LENGTH=178 /DNA_ID=CAMNT_0017234529 /DNA_START=1 /DNA_END=537 /DNA_ORIENTATION=+
MSLRQTTKFMKGVVEYSVDIAQHLASTNIQQLSSHLSDIAARLSTIPTLLVPSPPPFPNSGILEQSGEPEPQPVMDESCGVPEPEPQPVIDESLSWQQQANVVVRLCDTASHPLSLPVRQRKPLQTLALMEQWHAKDVSSVVKKVLSAAALVANMVQHVEQMGPLVLSFRAQPALAME